MNRQHGLNSVVLSHAARERGAIFIIPTPLLLLLQSLLSEGSPTSLRYFGGGGGGSCRTAVGREKSQKSDSSLLAQAPQDATVKTGVLLVLQ